MEQRSHDPETLEKVAAMLKAIAHPVRIAIVGYLGDGKKRTVTEIHRNLRIEQSVASHHLAILRDRGVLSCRREGKNILYFLKHEKLKNILDSAGECCGQKVI
jgi:DNA-binding transcriptional ArsR family regulator